MGLLLVPWYPHGQWLVGDMVCTLGPGDSIMELYLTQLELQLQLGAQQMRIKITWYRWYKISIRFNQPQSGFCWQGEHTSKLTR